MERMTWQACILEADKALQDGKLRQALTLYQVASQAKALADKRRKEVKHK